MNNNVKNAVQSVSEEEFDDIHRIVVKLTTRKLDDNEKSRLEHWLDAVEGVLRRHAIAMLLALFGLLVGSWILQREWFQDAALTAAVFIAALMIALVSLMIVGIFPFINTLRKNPYSFLHRNIRASALMDMPEMAKLLQCRRAAISVYLLHYKHERDSFERRTAMISGALDKIGFFPALAAFVSVGYSLWAHSQSLVRVFVFLVPAFYIIAFLAGKLLRK